MFYAVVLGKSTSGHLKELDNSVRKEVSKWLRLPHDVPLGYYYAPNREGGLGIPCLETVIPRLTSIKLGRLEHSKYPAAVEAFNHVRMRRNIKWARQALAANNLDFEPPTKEQAGCMWAGRLHASVDGVELRESRLSTLSTNWITRNAPQIPGGEYVRNVHTHINTIPSRMRISRGQRNNRLTQCRAGCDVSEPTAHTI